jgi:lysophospholipase L1-like esterase
MASKRRTRIFALITLLACLGIAEALLKISGVNRAYRTRAEEFKKNPLNFQAAMRAHRYEPPAPGGGPAQMPDNYLVQAYDPDLFWTVKSHSDYYPDRYAAWFKASEAPPSQRKEKINALGFRDREVPAGKAERELRIVCMGDSCTFGLGVYRDETFAARLNRLILKRDPDYPVSVFNAGTPGYTSYQGRVLLKKKILRLKPDIVIISYGINDNAKNRNIADAAFARLLRETPLKRFQEKVLAKSEIYLGLKQLIQYGQFRLASGAQEKKPRVPLPDFRENYRVMIEGIQSSGAAAVIYRPALAGHGTTDYLDALQDIARGAGARYFDGKAYFEEAFSRLKAHRPALQYNDLFIDALHPSPLGHQVIAEGLMACLVSEGLVP